MDHSSLLHCFAITDRTSLQPHLLPRSKLSREGLPMDLAELQAGPPVVTEMSCCVARLRPMLEVLAIATPPTLEQLSRSRSSRFLEHMGRYDEQMKNAGATRQTALALYEVQPALEAPLLRRLFYANEFYMPPLPAAHAEAERPQAVLGAPVADRIALSAADRQALAHLFPAYHNKTLFCDVEDFVDHCRSEAHMFFCENLPLTPLVRCEHNCTGDTAATMTRAGALPHAWPRDCSVVATHLTQLPHTPRFHELYARVHRVLGHHLARLLSPPDGRASRYSQLRSARVRHTLAHALASVLATSMVKTESQACVGGAGLNGVNLATVLEFVTTCVASWWRPSHSRPDCVPSALRMALEGLCGGAGDAVERHVLTPLALHVAADLVCEARRKEAYATFEDLCSTRSETTPPSDNCRGVSLGKRARDEHRFFDVLLSLALCDPVNRTPLVP